MNKSFYPLTVSDIRRETHNAVSIAFKIPENLIETFQFQAGQYLTFKFMHNGEEIRRSYSLCSSPVENEWRVAIKKVPGGVFSTYANEQLQVGDVMEVMPPHGKFVTQIEATNNKQYVFFAAGSGITPVIGLIKTILFQSPKSEVSLFYGNTSRDQIIFKEELDALKNRFMGRFSLHYFLSQERMDSVLFMGRLDDEKCQTLFNCFPKVIQADEFFICGPFNMIQAVKKSLESAKVDKRNVHFELFTAPGQSQVESNKRTKKIEKKDYDGKASRVSVKVDGIAFDFVMPYSGKSILEAAMDTGADLPYACKGGVCATCKARLIEGTVDMDVNYALEEDELKRGYILTCQSHPTSDRTIVDYDH